MILSKHRILVVDDVPASAKTLAVMLHAIGQEVEMCTDGAAALEMARQFLPHVIFLDIGMPQTDGYEVARRLRQIQEVKSATLIALTSYGQEEDRRRALEAGFNYHWVKPTSIEALEQLISQMPEEQSQRAVSQPSA